MFLLHCNSCNYTPKSAFLHMFKPASWRSDCCLDAVISGCDMCRSTTRCATERLWNISDRSTTTPTEFHQMVLSSCRAGWLLHRIHSGSSSPCTVLPPIQCRTDYLRRHTVMTSVLSGLRRRTTTCRLIE